MILRSVTRHVREQNWFAIGIDFLIVIVGVFIGIQVANWNEARVEKEREHRLLAELRQEAIQNAEAARSVGEGLMVGADAARRVLAMSNGSTPLCETDCWPLIVDLMHASQWQQLSNRWTTYEELRRAGLPSDRRIIEAVESFLQSMHRGSQALEIPTEYRTLVRRRIPVDLQDIYWADCFEEPDGYERYIHPCPAPSSAPPVPPQLIEPILADPLLMGTLREWTGLARSSANSLVGVHQERAARILAAIDAAVAGR